MYSTYYVFNPVGIKPKKKENKISKKARLQLEQARAAKIAKKKVAEANKKKPKVSKKVSTR